MSIGARVENWSFRIKVLIAIPDIPALVVGLGGSQTARVADKIGLQAGQLQAGAKGAVAAVHHQGLTQTIEEVAAIAVSIAEAVEQQGATTAQIGRTVQHAAGAA